MDRRLASHFRMTRITSTGSIGSVLTRCVASSKISSRFPSSFNVFDDFTWRISQQFFQLIDPGKS